MNDGEHLFESFLSARKESNNLRRLQLNPDFTDFCSNDYLGFAGSAELYKLSEELLRKTKIRNGSGGSRLLSGNNIEVQNLENLIAEFHRSESALTYNSGYVANLGLLSCIAGRNDTLIYDELAHASIIDGTRLSKSNSFKFRHNNPNDLEKKLSLTSGNKFVIVEALYSMDGDFAPLKEISELCEQYGARLIVDEAHSAGIYGENGRGLVCELGLEEKVFARVITYGKAFGCHGAAVLGGKVLIQYLINASRPFIYTTALPPHSIATIGASYQMMNNSDNQRLRLLNNIDYFIMKTESYNVSHLLKSMSPIQSIIIPGNIEVKKVAAELQKSKFDVRPVLHPTVSAGTERIRICLHSFNTKEEITALCNQLNTELAELDRNISI